MPQVLEITDAVYSKDCVVLSGHGAYYATCSRPKATIPQGTTLTFWVPPPGQLQTGAFLDDNIGQKIDLMQFSEPYKWDRERTETLQLAQRLPLTYGEGEMVGNAILLPGKDLKLGKTTNDEHFFTPDEPILLETLLTRFIRGNLHWSACTQAITKRGCWVNGVNMILVYAKLLG